MTTSFMQHRDRGFWIGDLLAELWLYFVRREIDQMTDAPGWLRLSGRTG
ncbi:hypothetical protein [Amycolatopsis thermoflava]